MRRIPLFAWGILVSFEKCKTFFTAFFGSLTAGILTSLAVCGFVLFMKSWEAQTHRGAAIGEMAAHPRRIK
jgi:hypothetical protein